MDAIQKAALLSVAVALFATSLDGQQGQNSLPPGYLVDFSPIEKAKGDLDVKIKFTSKTAKGDLFERGVQIKGPATEKTAHSVYFVLMTLYENHEWEFKEISKTELLIIGKKGSPVEMVEIAVEGLDKKFHPLLKQIKKS